MPACSCFAVTASTNINYVESSSCFWEFECTGSGYNNGSLFYTATCTGAVVLNYFSSGFAGAYRINGVAKGSWSIGSNGTFSFSVNAGDVVSILISSIGTIHNPNDFYGDLSFSAATPTPLPTEPTVTPTVTPSPTPSATPFQCISTFSQGFIITSSVNQIDFQNLSYEPPDAAGPSLFVNFYCSGNVRINIPPTKFFRCTGIITVGIAAVVQQFPLDTFRGIDISVDVDANFINGCTITLNAPITAVAQGDCYGTIYYNSVISNTPTPTASVTATPFNTNPTSSPTPSPSAPPPTPSVTLSPTPSSTASTPTPAPATASPTISPTPSGTGPTPTPTPTTPFTLVSCGNNDGFQFGDGTTTSSSFLTQSTFQGPVWVNTSIGNFAPSSGISSDGKIYTWGVDQRFNSKILLGQNTSNGDPYPISLGNSPAQIYGNNSGWIKCGISASSALALKSNGELWGWGYGGYVGDNTNIDRSSMVQIAGSWQDIANVNFSTSNQGGIKKDGSLWIWGTNRRGELGNNTTSGIFFDPISSPVQVLSGSTWKSLSIGGVGLFFQQANSVVAIKSDDTLWGWGWNGYGQLGTNNVANASVPIQEITQSTWLCVSNEEKATYAIKSDFSLWGWGRINLEQFGPYVVTKSSPTLIDNNRSWISVSAGSGYFLLLDSLNNLWGGGNNVYGALGSAPYGKISQLFTNYSGWNKISAGYSTSRFLLQNFPTPTATISPTPSPTLSSTPLPTNPTPTPTPSSSAPPTTCLSYTNSITYDFPVTLTGNSLSFQNPSYQSGFNAPALYVIFKCSGRVVIDIPVTTFAPCTGYVLLSVAGIQVQYPFSSTQNVYLDIFVDNYDQCDVIFDNPSISCVQGVCTGQITYQSINFTPTPTAAPTGCMLPYFTANMVYSFASKDNISFYNTPFPKNSSCSIDVRFLCAGTVTCTGANNIITGSLTVAGSTYPVDYPSFNNGPYAVKANDTLSFSVLDTYGVSSEGSVTGNIIFNALSPTESPAPSATQPTSTPTPSGQIFTPTPTPSGGVPTPQPDFSSTPTPTVGPSATPAQSPTTTPIPTPTPFFGYLWSFGYNYYGQLGNVSDQNSVSYVQTYYNSPIWRTLGYVNGQSNVAIKNDGTMWVWGLNAYGNLGDGTTANKSYPVQISLGGTDWTHAALGLKNLVALKTDGSMYVCGDNSKGQLGVNSTASLNILVRTGFNKLWKYAISGKNSIFALATDNTLWAAGSNAYGQLGNISTTDASRFVQVSTDKTWTSIDSQGYCAVAITTQGTLWTWGTNNSGQLGINVSNVFLASVSSPVQVFGGGSNWTQVAAGYSSFYALKSDNTLWAWGSNAFGELGDGTTIPRSSPTLTAFGASWLSLAAGVQNVVAIRNDGYLYAWGKNDRAQLGNIGTTKNVSQPAQLLGPIYNVSALSGGFSSTSLLTRNTPAPTNSPAPSATIPPPTPSPTRSPTPSPSPSSTAATPTPQPTLPQGYFMANAGMNINGAMGNNTAPNTNVYPNFTLVTGSDDVWIKSVYGQNYGLAIRSDFTLWSWGENYKGQLGNSSLNSASQPTAVLSGFTDWTYISSISSTSLAIRSNNLMYLWGDNAVGQCGTEDTFDKVIPTQVLGLWRQGQASMTHTAAIRTDGTLWLFGSNAYGQLGTNNRTWCSSPVQECTNSFWRMVSVSRQGTTAAIKTDNTLWLWGSNSYGQLGIGNTINQSSPVQESTLSSWEAVSCGTYFVVAINKDGSLWAWGDNRFGQLGTNDTTTFSNPVQTYAGGNNWLTISCSGDVIAATRQGSTQIWVWGYGGCGSLGTGSLNNVSSPTQLLASGTNQWQSISAGICNSSVLFSVVPTPTPTASRSPSPTPTDPSPTPTPSPSSTDPSPTPSGSASPTPSPTPEPETRLWMFGDNYFGQLGNNKRVDSKEITRTFYSTSDWATVNCSKYYCTYALKWNGTLWGYGDNEFGQLATSDTNDRSIPTQIIGGGQWSSVNGGLYHAAGIKANGTLWSWGANSYGALGNNSGPIQNYALSSPVQEYSKTSQWAQVSCGADFTIALKKDGTVWSWGWNKYGQSGTGEQPSVYPSYSVPVQEYYHENGWAAITTTLFTAAAIKVNGSLYTWGNGFYGATGLNNQLVWYYPKPVDITIPTPALAWVRIAGGNLHMLGIKNDSTLWTWGDNSYGQLGDNTTISRSSPVKVPISGQWVQVAGGYNFSAAIKVDGSLWTWGQNRNFSLGNISSAFNVSFPTQVDTGYLKWRTVSAGYYQVGLITSNFDPTPTPTITGSPQPTPSITPSPTPAPLPTLAPQYGQLWLWGDNQYGQIGDDTTVYRSSIVQTICAGQDWNNFSIKYTHTAAIKDDGSLWMWGDNTLGGLGDNTKTSRSSPVQTVSQTYDWLAVSAGYRFTIGLKQDSTLWSWGTNNLGQLGLDSTVAKSSPNQITAGPVVGWQKISAGYLHAAAVARDGSLWCWGNNSYGQVGLVNPTNISQPIQTAIGGNDWQDVSCGRNFTLALKKNGSVWAWGVNAYGQYGNNTVVLRRTPVNVINGTSLWVQISAGNNFSAGLASGIVTTPTPTASASPQPTPSVTPSPTPTSTAPSPTPSGTEPSPTPTPSPSATGPTPSPTSSATVTPTPSPSPSPTTTPSPTPSPDPYRENELNVWYRIFSRFSLEFPIEYQQGQLITYAYRVVTRCRPLQQPLAPFSAPLPCPSRSILTIFATSVTDVCKQLQAMDWIWKIDSMEKYTKPVYSIEEAYLIAKGEYNPAIVEFVPVTFCEYGACADFCIDYFLTEEADMQFEWLPICIPVYNPTTMSYDCQSSIIMGGGTLKIFGSAQVKTNNIISAGIIAVGGEADYTHGPSVQETLSWYGQGFVYIGGSAICTLPDVVTYNDTFYGNCSLELQQQVVIILDEVEQLDTFTTPTGIARTDLCACKNIPLQIALETNFTKQNNFNLFINRNALTFTGNFASTYNENTRRYTYSTTYNTIYESGSWSIICNINCNNDLDNFDVEPIWTLTFMFRNVLDNGQKLDSTIEVWLPASQFCPAFGGNVISFSLAINVKTLTCVANNNTNIVNVFINDGANIFTSAAWNQDPILTISGSPAS